MSMIFFTFRAQTGARQGVVMLKRRGISVRLGKTPGVLAVNGCGYGLWIPQSQSVRAAETMRKNGISYERSYLMNGKNFDEVHL